MEGENNMTLQELIESTLVKDDDHIRLYTQIDTDKKRIATGNWYHDQILKVLKAHITEMKMDTLDDKAFWEITLDGGDSK